MKVHFLGIGGSGVSAGAAIAKAQGFEISGCDNDINNEFTANFPKEILFKGHSKDHLEDVDILAVTPAIYSLDPNNDELVSAKEKGIEVLTWQEFLGQYLTKDKKVIAVCGTHGKSTTTAMVGCLLEDAGLDPTVELGAIVPKWGVNYRTPTLSSRAKRGDLNNYFVVEADEFNDNFLSLLPEITIVTNIEMDHPEFFKNFDDYKKSFEKFLSQTKKTVIANLSDRGVKSTHLQGGMMIDYSKSLINFPLKVPGDFNRSNASAVYQLGLQLNIDPQLIQKSLQSFAGVGRRFERIGNYKGAEIYSDFAHHPTEIKVTMEAAREKFPDKKIIVIFQPHMFSRTYGLFDDFVKAFQDLPADETFIIDIYPSREIDQGLVTSQKLVDKIAKESVKYIGSEDRALNWAKENAQNHEVIFFLGAGNTDKLAKTLVSTSAS